MQNTRIVTVGFTPLLLGMVEALLGENTFEIVDSVDISEMLDSVRSRDPDVVLLGAGPREASALVAQLRECRPVMRIVALDPEEWHTTAYEIASGAKDVPEASKDLLQYLLRGPVT